MSAAGTPSTDPWVIVSRERVRYEEQFRSLKPINGIITGDQAKGFLLQSQLPPLVLGQIWGLADTNADGKMDINEFSIACKLINLKLRGFEVPKVLPPNLIASLRMHASPPAIPPLPTNIPPPASIISPPQLPVLPANIIQPPPSTGIIQPPPSTGIIQPPPSTGIIQQPPSTGYIQPPPSSGIIQPPVQQPLIPNLTSIPPMSTNVAAPQPLIQTANFSAPLLSNSPITTNLPNLPPSLHQTPLMSMNASPAPSIPSATNTPRASITSVDRAAVESPLQLDWSVPHQTKLKYTQIFNTTDRTRTGFLSGVQARNVMVQTKLPQNLLAQIWALSDMDSDGRLGCEEFVLAMHLCEQAALGVAPPTTLPADLIPPSFRRVTRTNSVSSQGSVPIDLDPASTLLSTTFEDKRKENFEKGQAELERRRKTLLEQQRKEAEERERKEREEIEKREKARQEAERRRIEELEKQMREQQEQERLKEEERKRQSEQREAARREMERQRQLEWEKQRSQELQQQRQREQENVLKLKARNQSLTIELSSLNEQIKDMSQKICDTRVGVSNVKSTIDGMRSTRDSQMQEMSQLKNKLKEQNAKLLALSQEKVKLDTKNKINQQINEQNPDQKQFDNKEIIIRNLKEKVDDLQSQIGNKMSDIENNNSQLNDLKTQLANLVGDCETLYMVYEEKRDQVLEMKNSVKSIDYNTAWKNTDDQWGATDTKDSWPADDWGTTATTEVISTPPAASTVTTAACRYRALYEFVARNTDEISFQPGDIINVPLEQTGEPGWLAGEIRGHTGWFPESYVEPIDGVGLRGETADAAVISEPVVLEETERKPLEGIAEIPETIPEPAEISYPPEIPQQEPEQIIECCIASYPYQSLEQGDLSFNAGDLINIIKKDGDWWTGKLGDSVGIFPCNYVTKYDPNAPVNIAPPIPNDELVSAASAVVDAVAEDSNISQTDNEVSQITANKPSEKSPDYSAFNTQTLRNSKKPEIAQVIAPYQSSSTEQLSLQRGQLIMIRKKTDSGWWEGELQAKGRRRQVGWFPASYVKVLNSSGRTSGRTTPVSTTRIQQEVVIDKVVALYPYTAANPDELSFMKDDIISVTVREEPSWWRGEINGVSGLFPSNYVTPLQQSSVGPEDKQRQDCINELIQTEKTYIDDMTVVYEVFELPLRQSKIISTEEIDGIFVNWQDILQCNRNFLRDLIERWNSGNDVIGDVICAHLPLMTAYITFCSKQLESAALLQRLTETSASFRNIVKQCQSHRSTRGMPLSSFLIKPMQRITRYPLLISKILENTPKNYADNAFLVEALQIADRFLNRLNENVRLKENEERLQWLQNNIQLSDFNIVFNSSTNKLGPRKLLHHGVLTKVKSGKELIGFLLNDFFMLVQPSKSLGTTQFTFQRNNTAVFKVYKQPILMKDLKVSGGSSDAVDSGTDSTRLLKLQDKKQTISLLALSANECSLWLKRFDSAKEVYNKVASFSKTRPKSTPQSGVSCGRLLVLVQKGTRFIRAVHSLSRSWIWVTVIEGREIYSKNYHKNSKRKGKPHCDNIYCKVSLGSQEQATDIATDNIINGSSPQNGAPQVPMLIWNHSMQFLLKNVHDEVLTIVVYEMCAYRPDEFLGRAEVKLGDIYQETQTTNGPITKKLILHQVESGEVTIKLDMQMFSGDF